MKIPKMVLFDYGQTLVAEQKFDGVKGTEAVLQYAIRNTPYLYESQGIEIALSSSEIDTLNKDFDVISQWKENYQKY